jgi:hypothetical protein
LSSHLKADSGVSKKLTDMRGKNSRIIQALATTMRLTHQSRYKAERAEVASRKAKVGKEPWKT